MKRVVVIGGGPGGYVAAIRAAQLGADVTLVEKGELGGTCLNRGCIPTKVLLHTAELYSSVKGGKRIGLNAEGLSVDWKTLMDRKSSVVKQLTNGVKALLSSNGVSIVQGEGSFAAPQEVLVTKKDGTKESLKGDAFVIATGSMPVKLPLPGMDLDGVITSDEALSLDEIPESIVIVGGGVIGMEFASVFSSLGSQVTVVEMLPEILPPMDSEMAAALKKIMERKGVRFHTSTTVAGITREKDLLQVKAKAGEEELSLAGKKVLVAVGRKPYTAGLNLEGIGVKVERGRITVNERMETSVAGIYAIGDCASPIMLAHVAMTEGATAAENIMGEHKAMNYKAVPNCLYTSPELAGVGLTEEEAKKRAGEVKVGRFPLAANGKALILGETQGMVKIIADAKYGEILGLHILGPKATELIAEGAMAMTLEATLEEITSTIHAHPTVGEAIFEAALAADGISIHMPKR